MEIMNLKHQKVSLICKFPPKDNTNSFPIFGFTKTFNFVKQNWIWIGFISFLGWVGYQILRMRMIFGNWDPVSTSVNEFALGDMIGYIILGLGAVLLAGLTWGRSAPSGRTQITRSTSDSVDGFGGARGLDYSHGASGRMGKGPLPVSLSKERIRTATFKEGAKDRIEYDEEKLKRRRSKKKR